MLSVFWACVVSHSAWSTTSPVKMEKAATGAMAWMAAYMLSSSVVGVSHLWAPFFPAGNCVLPGASFAVYGLLRNRQRVSNQIPGSLIWHGECGRKYEGETGGGGGVEKQPSNKWGLG